MYHVQTPRGILDSIGKLISALFRTVFNFVKKLLKKLWPLLLVIAIIYFAPAISSWLTSLGGPSWLSGAFTWLGSTVTPFLQSALGSIWSGLASIGSSLWTAFSAASLGVKLGVIGLGAALLAPEETKDVIGDIGTGVGDVVGGVIEGGANVVGALLPSPFVLVAGCALLWFLFRDNDDSTHEDG